MPRSRFHLGPLRCSRTLLLPRQTRSATWIRNSVLPAAPSLPQLSTRRTVHPLADRGPLRPAWPPNPEPRRSLLDYQPASRKHPGTPFDTSTGTPYARQAAQCLPCPWPANPATRQEHSPAPREADGHGEPSPLVLAARRALYPGPTTQSFRAPATDRVLTCRRPLPLLR